MKIVENANMKLIKDKKLLVGADNSGSSLKNVIVAHLRKKAGKSKMWERCLRKRIIRIICFTV